MKKWFFTVSIIIVIAGLVAAVAAYRPEEILDHRMISDLVHPPWSTTTNLTKGQSIWVDLRQGLDWPVGLFDPGEEPFQGWSILYVGVNITSPGGNMTIFLIRFAHTPENANLASQGIIKPLAVLDINVTRDYGAVDPSPNYKNNTNSYWIVGGIAQYGGVYTFTVQNLVPSRKEPPSRIDIRELFTVTKYPYTYLLPVGATTSAGGAALMWFSLRKKQTTRRQKET